MIAPYLTQTMTVRRVTGRSLSGDPILADAVSVPCRFEFDRRLVRDATGQEVTSEATVFTVHDVGLDDRLLFGGREYPVLAISRTPTITGETLFLEVSV